MNTVPTIHSVRAAKILARKYLSKKNRAKWDIFLGTTACEWLAFCLVWKDFKRALRKEIISGWYQM